MLRHARGLLRLALAVALAIIGLAIAFVVAPAQGSPDQLPAEQTQPAQLQLST